MNLQLVSHFADPANLGDGTNQGINFISQHLAGEGHSLSSHHYRDGPRVTDRPPDG
jgi:hypothetical protein